MSHIAEQIRCQTVSETRAHSLGAIDVLDSGELFTGTPTITEVTTTDLTIANKAVSVKTLEIDDISHAAGQALQCTVTSATAGTYEILWTCGTDATPAQTITGKTTIIIEDD